MKRTWFIMVHSSVFNIVLSSQIESLALAPWAPEALSKKKIAPQLLPCRAVSGPQKGLPMLLTLLTLLATLLLRFNADSEAGGIFTKGHASLISCEQLERDWQFTS